MSSGALPTWLGVVHRICYLPPESTAPITTRGGLSQASVVSDVRVNKCLFTCVVRSRRGVPGAERGGVRRVDGGVAGGVVARVAAGRAGAPRHGRAARPQARAAGRRPLPRRRAPRLRHDRGNFLLSDNTFIVCSF